MSDKLKYELILIDLFTKVLEKADQESGKASDHIAEDFEKIKRHAKSASQDIEGVGSKLSSLGKGIGGKLGGLAAGFFAIDGIRQLGAAAIETSAKYQTLQAVLENTFGNTGQAREALANITGFAAKTPFQVDELSSSLVKLANQGFTPTMAQLTNLGDLASSTGKGFEQLTEAIIDAQVGEFERLKDFGVRAQKEGDNIRFTFKGQETQVKFTAAAIREYVLGLGRMAGVQGAMNKISQTTAGQISNLKDNWDQLLKTLGDSAKGPITATIAGLSGMVAKAKSLIEIPMSQKMEDERLKVNQLSAELMNSLTPYERRKQILSELKEINGDLVKGLDAENLSYSKLTGNIEEYNRKAIQRIALETRKAELQKINETASEALLKEQDAQAQVDKAFTNIQDKIRRSNLPSSKQDVMIKSLYDPVVKENIAGIVAKYYQGGAQGQVQMMNALQRAGYAPEFFSDNLAEIYLGQKKLYEARRSSDQAQDAASNFAKGVNALEKILVDTGVLSSSGSPSAGASGFTGLTSGLNDGIKSGVDSITGDVKAAKNVIINLNSLIHENNNFFDNAKEGDAASFLDKLKIALQAVLNDVNYGV